MTLLPITKTPAAFLKMGIVCALVLLCGLAFSPDRVWANLLLISFYAVTLALGGMLFIALTYVCGAAWNVGFRRVPEAMAGTLPVVGIALLAVLAFRMNEYGWHPHGEVGTFWFKEMWSNPVFWMIRAVVIIVLWIGLSWLIVTISQRQDHSGDSRLNVLNRRISALFLVVFAATFTIASCDWIMLLEPLWFSTIWGVYNFAGMIQATLAVMVILALSLRAGPLKNRFTDEHLHDLGKLLLGFSCFWMYIWFSQYMLIWYTNIPEETAYYLPRTHGAWGPVMAVNIVLNWVIPFFVLLPRPCKRSSRVMIKIAAVVLIGRWVDLYLMIFPAFPDSFGKVPGFGLWEIAAVGFLAGSFGWLFYRRFFAVAPVPRRDPLLADSLHYHC